MKHVTVNADQALVADTITTVDGEMEITAMGDGQRRSRMPSATLMRWRKMLAEGIRCASCGNLFQPARRGDATFCSSPCRQRAHRQRVTAKQQKLNDGGP